jgi:hypothetical protein
VRETPGERLGETFEKSFSQTHFKTFYTIGQVESVQIRCIKYGDTNYKKIVRDLARSAQPEELPNYNL